MEAIISGWNGGYEFVAQAKVLRALQENKITRVGGEKESVREFLPLRIRIWKQKLKSEISGRFISPIECYCYSCTRFEMNEKKDIPVLQNILWKRFVKIMGCLWNRFHLTHFLPCRQNHGQEISGNYEMVERLVILSDKKDHWKSGNHLHK